MAEKKAARSGQGSEGGAPHQGQIQMGGGESQGPINY